MATASDVVKQMRTDMLADSGLTNLLGTNDIFRTFPDGPKKAPFLVMMLNNRNPVEEISGVGLHRPNYAFDLFVINPWDADPIFDYLQQNWTIPTEKTAAITSNGARMDYLYFDDLLEIPGNLMQMSNRQLLRQFNIPISMRIVLPEV